MMDSVSGLDLLASAILILDRDGIIVYVNPAAEDLFESSSKVLLSQHLKQVFPNSDVLEPLCEQVVSHDRVEVRQELVLERVGRPALHVHCIVKPVDLPEASVLIELRENIAQIRQERENRLVDQTQANRELVRNLAHEIKNPLGGIRGAAQLLEMELPGGNEGFARIYPGHCQETPKDCKSWWTGCLCRTGVRISKSVINIHEVCERVRSLILAGTSEGLENQPGLRFVDSRNNG